MFQTPQFVTGPFTPQRVFLPDREYGLALDALVKGCSDVLIVSSCCCKVLLGRRKVEPQPDWWFIGGRSRPGDTTQAAASRNVKRELGLDFAPTRFHVVANYSMVWSYREQAPTTNGTADLSTIHALFLSEKEETNGVSTISLDPKEYHESKWWNIEDVISQEERFHPLLRNSLKSLKAKLAMDQLEESVSTSDNNNKEDIVKHAMALVAAVKEAKITESSIKVIFDTKSQKYIRVDDDYKPLIVEENGDNDDNNNNEAEAKRQKVVQEA